MRPRLLQSFVLVVLFWFCATTVWWSFQRPEVNLAALRQLKSLLPFLPFEPPAQAAILGSLAVQKNVLVYWTFPMLVGTVVSAMIGYGIAWLLARGKAQEREAREQGKGVYRGVTLTVGELPLPRTYPRDSLTLSADEDESLARLTAGELALLGDILGTISAHPAAYVGESAAASLLDHTLEVVEPALARPRFPGLTAIVAAAHEMGKILAFESDGAGGWKEKMTVDKGATIILRTLESWHRLPNPERAAVLAAVQFHSTPERIPEPDGDKAAAQLAKDLLAATDDSRQEVEQAAKETALAAVQSNESASLSDQIFEAFIQALPTLAFQHRGLPKAVPAAAWKLGNRVFLLEIRVREQVTAKLPDQLRSLLTPAPKQRPRVQPFTVELLKAFAKRGWLVTEVNGTALPADEALWNVQAGKLEFKGVMLVTVPDEYMQQLPQQDSMYDLAITGPLYTPTTPVFSRNAAVLEGMLTPPPGAAR